MLGLCKDQGDGFLRGFFNQGTSKKSLNFIVLVMILKKGEAKELNDFRPFKLIGAFYKLLSITLANRLKKVVGKVVSIFQHVFVEGNQTLDMVLLLLRSLVQGYLQNRCREGVQSHQLGFLNRNFGKMSFG